MIVRTEAIALRSIDYGETSQIVTLFTRSHGRVTVIAKGSRGTRARFGSTMQPMSHIQVVFYYKPGRDVHSLSEASHVSMWRNMTRDLEKLGAGLRIVELVNALFLEEDPHQRMFDTVVRVLARIDEEHDRPGNLWLFLQLQIATELGFEPAFEKTDVEAVRSTCYFSLAEGRIVDGPGSDCVRIDRSTMRAFAVLARGDESTAVRMRLARPVAGAVGRLVESYLRYHVERAYPTRASRVIAQLEGADLHPTAD